MQKGRKRQKIFRIDRRTSVGSDMFDTDSRMNPKLKTSSEYVWAFHNFKILWSFSVNFQVGDNVKLKAF